MLIVGLWFSTRLSSQTQVLHSFFFSVNYCSLAQQSRIRIFKFGFQNPGFQFPASNPNRYFIPINKWKLMYYHHPREIHDSLLEMELSKSFQSSVPRIGSNKIISLTLQYVQIEVNSCFFCNNLMRQSKNRNWPQFAHIAK